MARVSTASRTTRSKAVLPQTEPVAAPEVEEAPASKQSYKVRRDLPLNMIVTVRNGFNGRLVYKSPRTGERFVWDAFGDEQDLEFQELRNARNSQKAFFENNWFLIDDQEVIDALGVAPFYKNALGFDEFDELFDMSAAEIENRVAKLSKGQQASVKYRAKQKIADGEIDSIRVITALEKSLGVQLIER